MRFGLSKAIVLLLMLVPYVSFSQQTKEQKKELREAQNHLSQAHQELKKDKFNEAEADFRKAIALNPKDQTAKYNLGNAYYEKEKNAEAMHRFLQSARTAKTKEDKHRAFHNLGNTFMNAENYQDAVEAYKSALRNNPKDDETRYNLALAKEMLEKNPPDPDDQNQDDQDQSQDQQDQDQDQDQDQGDDQDDNQDQDEGDDENDDQNKDQQEGGEDDGDEDNDEGQPEDPDNDDSDNNQQQPARLSPQQIESLLEAMDNEEKKVQEKMNAEKQKGVKVQSDKDW